MAKPKARKRHYKIGGTMKIEGKTYKVIGHHNTEPKAKKQMKAVKAGGNNARVIRRYYHDFTKHEGARDYWVIKGSKTKKK